MPYIDIPTYKWKTTSHTSHQSIATFKGTMALIEHFRSNIEIGIGQTLNLFVINI